MDTCNLNRLVRRQQKRTKNQCGKTYDTDNVLFVTCTRARPICGAMPFPCPCFPCQHAQPPCWRAPICPSLGAAFCAARLSGCCHAPPVPRSGVQHGRARPACVQRPARPTASMRPHGPQGLLCSSVPSEHGGDVDDRSSVTFLGLSVTFSVTPIEPQSLPQWTLYCDCKTHTGQGAAL